MEIERKVPEKKSKCFGLKFKVKVMVVEKI